MVGYTFCSTAATIVSGGLAERVTTEVYAYVSVLMSSIVYPVVAGWVWGGGWLA